MLCQIVGAILKKEGVTFAVVLVKRHMIETRTKVQEAKNAYSYIFPGMPIILVAQDSVENPTYYGKKDIVSFLAKINPRSIPWKRYTVE